AADEVFAVGADVDAVRRLAAWDQIDHAGRLFRIDDFDAADRLELASVDGLLRLLPVHGGDVVAVFLRRSDFEFASGAFGVVAGPERPTFARPLTRVAQVPIEGGGEGLEGDGHLRGIRVHLHARDQAVVLRRVFFNRRIRAFRQRHREARGGQNVFGIRRHERSAVKTGDVRDRSKDLFDLEVAQVNPRDAIVGVVVDEEPAPVV